jgi:hypothetical protein
MKIKIAGCVTLGLIFLTCSGAWATGFITSHSPYFGLLLSIVGISWMGFTVCAPPEVVSFVFGDDAGK